MSNFTFFKQWAQYRKSGQLQNPLVALNHRPNNMQELSFLLQITTSFSLLHFLPLKTLQSPYNSTLMMTSVDNNLICTKMNSNFIQSILQLYKQLTHDTNTQSHLQLIRTLFVEILSKIYKKSQYGVKSQKKDYLLFLGVCFDKLAKTKQTKESLECISRWWTTKKQFSDYICKQSLELLVLWGYFQQKNQMQWLQDAVSISSKSLDIWMNQLEITLSQQKAITQSIITSVQKQMKQFCTLWQIRNTKSFHSHIKQVKFSILKRYSSYNKSTIFATLFTCLQVFAQEAEAAVFLYDDLVQYENLFYVTLLDLQKQDHLYLFPKFHSFMRQQSVLGVLQINYSLTAQLQNFSQKRPKQIQKTIQNKDVQMLTQFLVYPIKTSHLILDHYLELSGVKIKKPRDKPNSRPKKIIKMKIADPLLFILIAKDHWAEKFGYQTLGLSLWIITEAYCKQLTQKKQIPQKQLQQYIKKLKVTLCVFLLSLKYPTKMLNYLPEQADIANDFIFVPVIPSLLIETGYFFSEFKRDTLKIREKSQINSQVDILPWKYKLFILNNIASILHNHKGYEFYNIALKYISSINQKQYCEVILKSINAALQGLGLHQMGSEQQRQQCLSLLVKEQKLKEMQNLLLTLSKQGDKIGNAASQLLKLCSSSE